jgi:hypothetical protein
MLQNTNHPQQTGKYGRKYHVGLNGSQVIIEFAAIIAASSARFGLPIRRKSPARGRALQYQNKNS